MWTLSEKKKKKGQGGPFWSSHTWSRQLSFFPNPKALSRTVHLTKDRKIKKKKKDIPYVVDGCFSPLAKNILIKHP